MKAWVFVLILAVAGCTGTTGCGKSMGQEEPSHISTEQRMFADFGWRAMGKPIAVGDVLPADFKLRPGQFPWPVYLDLSKDAGLDFTHLAGAKVTMLRFKIEDAQGDRLKEIRQRYVLWGVALLDSEQKMVGAWLTYTDKQGNFQPGIPGFSLRGKTLNQVTGLTWPEYAEKRSGD
ncbi:MAG: hypothetical protein JWN15_890 [Firmicutes bacterium]|nr:hypothetical protein [Bacillota bacterium]